MSSCAAIFLQDDGALPLYILGLAQGVDGQIDDQVHRPGQLPLQDLDVEAGVFPGGEGVARPPQLVDFPGDVVGGAPGRPLEGHVLQD